MATPENTEPTREKISEDDEDLDDLDDVLDQFHQPSGRPRTNTRVDAPPKSVPGLGKGSELDVTDEADEDDLARAFSAELAKGMESLMKDLGGDALPGEDDESSRTLKAAWEKMLVDGLDDNIQGGMGSTSGSGNEFQSKIKQATNKLRESESKLKSDSSSTDPALEALLSSFESLGLDGSKLENEEEFTSMLENMMGQLVTKDILDDPMKELSKALSSYLESPPQPLNEEDKKRYEGQLTCVQQILTIFADPAYDDNNVDMKKRVQDFLTELQGYGSPPPDVIGPLPGVNLGADGLPDLPEECITA